jgi:multidrug resistance efflux pump
MNVDQFIAEKRLGKEREKAAKDEERREQLLREKMERGTRLSRKDREFIEARDAIAAAGGKVKEAQDQLAVAKENLEQLKIDSKTLDDMLKELRDLNGDIQQLLAMG